MVSANPWRELRALPHIAVEWKELPGGVDAITNGVDRILMDKWLTQTERRCALAHELQHILMGHSGHQRPAVERIVRAAVARKLISLEDLTAACAAGEGNQCDVAAELRVTPAVLLDRIHDLDEKERDALHITD